MDKMYKYRVVTEVVEDFDTEEEARRAYDGVAENQVDRDDAAVRTVSLYRLEPQDNGTTMIVGMESTAKGALGFVE